MTKADPARTTGPVTAAIQAVRSDLALTAEDIDTTVNCEPRILDTVLGQHLGMAQPRNIRAVIEANMSELSTYEGIRTPRVQIQDEAVCTPAVQTVTGGVFTQHVKNPGRGRPGTAYYLTEGQALCVCALSRAPNAPQVRRALIEAFMELRRRQVKALVSPQKERAIAVADGPPKLVDLFAAACKTLNGWAADGVVQDKDAALWVAFRATLKAAGVEATFRHAAPRRKRVAKR